MMTRDPLEYAMNRMENAAQSGDPAGNGYGPARRELLDGIAALRKERDQLSGTVDRLVETLEAEVRKMRELRGRKS